MMRSSIKPWLEAMRLRTLPVSVAGVIAAWGYALAGGYFSAAPALLCLVFAILCQIASNFANEYYDYKAGRDRAGREGPRRGVTEGDITPAAMKRATFGTLAAACAVGLTLTLWGGLWLILVGAGVGLGVLAYSTGPWPLSTHCLGEAAVVVFFGIVPVNFTCYVMSCAWSAPVFLGSVAIGLMGANVLIVNNYRDVPDDRAAGKHTLASLCPAAMPWLYAANAIAAMACVLPVWLAASPLTLIVPALYILASAAVARRMAVTRGRALTRFLGITSVLMLAYSLLFLVMTAADSVSLN